MRPVRLGRFLSQNVGLRRAAAIVFALLVILPLLTVVPLLHGAGLLASPWTQGALLLAVTLAVFGFVMLRRLTDEMTGPAQAPIPSGTAGGTEIGPIGDAFSHLLTDLRGSTERMSWMDVFNGWARGKLSRWMTTRPIFMTPPSEDERARSRALF